MFWSVPGKDGVCQHRPLLAESDELPPVLPLPTTEDSYELICNILLTLAGLLFQATKGLLGWRLQAALSLPLACDESIT
jgi:hypothetical protein